MDCRQDVPALRSGDRQRLRCPRCGASLRAGETADENRRQPGPQFEAAAVGPTFEDGWESAEQLRDIERILYPARRKSDATIDGCEPFRCDPPHAGLPHRHLPSADVPSADRTARGSKTTAVTWLTLLLGSSGFLGGACLLGWSLTIGQLEMWRIGLPLMLGGQVVLLLGLVLQIDRLRRESREAAARLGNVHRRLDDLNTAATLLGSSHAPGARSFYSHFAGGASPQLLLSDLKSQLDLLAMKIAQEGR
jgi:hypothetical protein